MAYSLIHVPVMVGCPIVPCRLRFSNGGLHPNLMTSRTAAIHEGRGALSLAGRQPEGCLIRASACGNYSGIPI